MWHDLGSLGSTSLSNKYEAGSDFEEVTGMPSNATQNIA